MAMSAQAWRLKERPPLLARPLDAGDFLDLLLLPRVPDLPSIVLTSLEKVVANYRAFGRDVLAGSQDLSRLC